ncbi:serine/threonine-protein kinase VPS15 [Cornus florida]|uniref:serine/threonine-protein kinase VPS15 n=1 Tax=Cornus florida TaxID=4283 RepID=UPI0028A2A2B8|nr:serine/threonine-protein kinase VPS15 [Cornus florida]
MGNKIARTTQASATEYYLHDLPSSYNLVLKEVLGRGRFLKSIQCKHDEGLVLVKVYFKRGDSIDLREYERRLAQIREIFRGLDHPHVWPFQFWLETDKAAYLLRQYFFNNLHDRLSTRPFLSLVEKKWLAFQLLYAVKQSHENGVCHGDIKCENVLVTSWNWLYLADFASFKPTYIPHDDPSDFSFFFDTGGRRRCYLAPERFYEHGGGEMQVAQDAPLRPSMDIFAVGCVIAELFLEGQPLFELSQLLAYRRGQYDPSQHLEKIPDSGIRRMILHMIQLDPGSRFSAENYLQSYAGIVFPCYFSPFLHNYYSYLNPLDSDTRVLMCQTLFQEILKQMMNNRPNEETGVALGTPSNALGGHLSHNVDTKKRLNPAKGSPRKSEEAEKGLIHDRLELLGDISTLLRDVKRSSRYSRVKPMLEDVANSAYSQKRKQCGMQSPGELLQTISNVFKRNHHPFMKRITLNELNSLMSDYDNQSDTFGMPFLPLPQDTMSCEGMVLIASLLCSCIRNVKLPHMRRGAVLLLKSCSLYIDDEDRLQRVLPYVVAMLSDPAAIVRCAALETLCDILPLVRDFPPSDAKIFPEYIIPMLSMLPDDPEESVRICYASNISKLALTAYGFLIHSISLSEAGVLNELSSHQKSSVSSTETPGRLQRVNDDAQLAQLRKSIAEVIQELVMGPKQTPNIRRALLQDIGNLCWFFGQRQSNDFLLPILPAFLNDRDEQLRAVFYGQIVYVCFFVGQRSVEEYLLPYIEQALSDASEAVIVNALDCLAFLCKSGFLRKRILLEMIERAFLLLCYPSQWVRRSVVNFIAASSESLGAVDSYVFLVPVIRPFLRRQPGSLASEKALLSCLKPPVSRQVFYQVLENARSSDMLERQRKIWYNSSAQSKQWQPLDLYHSGAGELKTTKGWSDKQHDLQGHKSVVDSMQQLDLAKRDDGDAKMSTMGTFMRNASSTFDIHDPLGSEKLQFSGLMCPQASGVNSFIYDKSSEGIPLYYFSVDKRAVANAPAASDSPSHLNSLGFGSSSMPWMDPVNKSFSMASSVPAPKLVSDSFSISSGSKQFHRVVHEAEGREADQTAYINNKFQDLGLSSTTKSSITAEDASTPTDAAGLPSFGRASVLDSGWRPRGVLVAHLQEHRSAVNDIAISTDHSFFVSASDDSTVKVWDSRKLEKDISFRSRLTYSLEGSRALCIATLQGSAQVIIGDCDGMIHIFSVDYISRGLGNVVEKYSGIADVKKKSVGEGAILSLLNYSEDGFANQMIMYSTKNCGIHLWDIRTNSNSWNSKVTPEEGYVSSLVTGPCGNWFVSGSSRGVLTLWDLRFLVPVNSWQYSAVCPIEKMCLFVPPQNNSVSTTARPLVYVAAGCNEVSLWNAENGSCHQVFRVANNDSDAESSDLPWALARSSRKANSKPDLRQNVNPKYRVDELNEPPSRLPGIRSLLPLPGGDLLTGGTDLKIRRWDHCRPDRSYCICGPSIKGVGNDDFYETKSSFGVQVVQETRRRPLANKLTTKSVLAAAATDSAGCHRDSVLSLASVKLNQRLLISSGRDGAIKVWK